MKILELVNISKSFGDKKVLENINMYVDEGEIVSLLGVSGSGKSTIFNIISGTISPNSGEVKLKEEDITNKKGKVSYMLQKDLLLPHLKILDNVSLPLFISKVDKNEARKEARTHFEEFGISNTEEKYPFQLSGGMRQRAALLRTYLNKKDIILLDEPFSALDMITKGKMHSWFKEIMKKIKLSGIFITHDIDEAIYLSDRIYILGNNGKIGKELKINRKDFSDEEFKLSREFLEYKKEILEELKENPKSKF